jgi:hypothetical protein
LGNDKETGPSTGLADDHLSDLAAAARPARIDIDLDQEGRSPAFHQRGAQQEPVDEPDLQRGAAADRLSESKAHLDAATAGSYFSESVGSLCDQLASDTLARSSDSRLARGGHHPGRSR